MASPFSIAHVSKVCRDFTSLALSLEHIYFYNGYFSSPADRPAMLWASRVAILQVSNYMRVFFVPQK
jgi:hypothetical protein